MTRQNLRDDVHLTVAAQHARLSKDINTQVGCVIVASDNTPVSWGYNGGCAGFQDDLMPYSRENMTLTYFEDGEPKPFSANKYPFMNHAESNAIFFADKSKLIGATLYVTGFPCEICAKEIARAKIGRVVVADSSSDPLSMLSSLSDVTKYLFAMGNIKLTINGKDVNLTVSN